MPAQALARSGSTGPRTSPVTPVATSPARVPAEDAYKTAVRPAIDKLKQLSPFLTSAASSTDPSVSAAILPTLLSVRSTLASLQPPPAAQGSHTMVLGAVDRILHTLAPEFTGDRSAVVRQSVTTIDVVGGVLAGE